jgi:serine phosphatase RsbU (regulator of sigma subunit)
VNRPTPEPARPVPDWPCGLVGCGGDGVITEVNDTFLAWTGYDRDELVGRRRLRDLLTAGGRMLYETHLGPLLAMYGEVAEVALDLKRADTKPLPVLVNAVVQPAAAGRGRGVRFAIVGAGERRSYEKELLEARRTAEAAGAASERVQRRLSLLADVNLILAGTLDLDVALQGLATTLATDRHGYCVVMADDGSGERRSWFASPTRDSTLDLTETLERAGTELGRALGSTTPQLISRIGEFGPTIVIPVLARDQQVATVVLARAESELPYTPDDLVELAGLADRIGLFVDNLRLYAREHTRAIALQQALLTAPARSTQLEIVTRYLPSADDAMVGGDWYDSFIRPDGATVIAIGDVVGHDHIAAAAMGQLRGLLRALAYIGGQSPAELLTAVDVAAHGLGVNTYATAVVAVFHPRDHATGERPITWASAGHLPPVVVAADGAVELLATKPDLMLGVDPARPRCNQYWTWQPGSTLMLYTDGLVEDAVRSLDDGLDALVALVTELAAQPLASLCDDVLARMSAGHRGDDIAVLAIRDA